MSLPDYNSQVRLANSACAALDISESHGLLCGLLSVSPQVSVQAWIQEVFNEPDPQNAVRREYEAVLGALHEQTKAALQTGDMSLVLLLPSEEYELSERAQALGAWSRGFLSGIGLVGGDSLDKRLSEESRGFLRDLVEIGKAEVGDELGEEEAAFSELEEYLRVGTTMLVDELNPATRQPIALDNNLSPGTIDALLFPEDEPKLH